AALHAGAAPVPLPAGLFAAGAAAPSLAAPVTASPLSPAPIAPLAPSPLPAAAAIAALPAAPAPARAEAPLEALRVFASPDTAPRAGALFDGARPLAAAASEAPPAAPESAAKPRRTLLQRYRDRRAKTPLQNAFGNALFVTAMTAAAVPVLWGAAPAMKLAYTLTAADLLVLAVIAPLAVGAAVWRKLRAPQTAAKPPPSRRAKLAALAAGVILGLGLAAVPYHATGPAAQAVHAYTDRGEAQAERERVRWIRGGAVEDEVVEQLSLNPVGRELLNQLRDRGGVLRLPAFFVSRQDDSYGMHENFFDGVYLNEGEIIQRGWTVERFLAEPDLQRALIREMNSTVVHELVHAVQGRRPPWTVGYFKNSIEAEQEAFFREMLYRLAELERDPAARNDGHDRWMVPDAADDIDGFLKSVADMYEKNVVVGDPYFADFLARQRARWPAFRVHIYRVLAARASTPASAKMYLDKAKAAAKEAGLSEPAPLVASR
ncbi:MAG: hypothetical protein NDJ72_03345, partial [Elusimicrobia bacterium]|nr:hypothetical protein [Elusimicrobiota bacterium]